MVIGEHLVSCKLLKKLMNPLAHFMSPAVEVRARRGGCLQK
ncbi:Unknown protein sequence [Pseudomonas savastanoi pv. glycinea]|nr:Unknown protein sequence [Pseudomonas savastanoi pv. glycinea]